MMLQVPEEAAETPGGKQNIEATTSTPKPLPWKTICYQALVDVLVFPLLLLFGVVILAVAPAINAGSRLIWGPESIIQQHKKLILGWQVLVGFAFIGIPYITAFLGDRDAEVTLPFYFLLLLLPIFSTLKDSMSVNLYLRVPKRTGNVHWTWESTSFCFKVVIDTWQLVGIVVLLAAESQPQRSLLLAAPEASFGIPILSSDTPLSSSEIDYSRVMYCLSFVSAMLTFVVFVLCKCIETLPFPDKVSNGHDFGEKIVWTLIFGMYREYPGKPADKSDVVRTIMDSMMLRASPVVKIGMRIFDLMLNVLYFPTVMHLMRILRCDGVVLTILDTPTCWEGMHLASALISLIVLQFYISMGGYGVSVFEVMLNRALWKEDIPQSFQIAPWFSGVRRFMLTIVAICATFLELEPIAATALITILLFGATVGHAWLCRCWNRVSDQRTIKRTISVSSTKCFFGLQRSLSMIRLPSQLGPLGCLVACPRSYPDAYGEPVENPRANFFRKGDLRCFHTSRASVAYILLSHSVVCCWTAFVAFLATTNAYGGATSTGLTTTILCAVGWCLLPVITFLFYMKRFATVHQVPGIRMSTTHKSNATESTADDSTFFEEEELEEPHEEGKDKEPEPEHQQEPLEGGPDITIAVTSIAQADE